MCGSALPERAIFCSACAKQARCKACRDWLEANARACVNCGTLVGEAISGHGDEWLTPSAAINTLNFQEDKAGRTVNFRFTDAAMASIGDTLLYALDQRLTRGEARHVQRRAPHTSEIPLLPSAAVSDKGGNATQSGEARQEANAVPDSGDLTQLREVFHHEGATLHLYEPRLKADSKLDYARRLSLLFIYAHEREGRPQVQRADLIVILEKVYDNNTKTFLRTHPGFEREADTFRLNNQGKDEAKAALMRIYNSSVEGPGWMPGATSVKDKGDESKSSAKSAGGKRGRKPSTKPKEWAEKWNAAQPSIDGHSLLEMRVITEKGIFALWAVSTVRSDGEKIVSVRLLSRFLLEAFIFKIEERALARALQSAVAKGKVLKMAGGFQLQPPGAKWAQELSSGKAV